MKAFTALYTALDETNKTNEKVEALTRYFASADTADAAWALYFLIGRRPRAAVTSTKLHVWAIEAAGIPDWLFGECYDAAGDFAETVALLLPEDSTAENDHLLPFETLHDWIEQVLLPLRDLDEASQRERILAAWHTLLPRERFVWNKLITGGFRVGVSQRLVVRALAAVSGVDDPTIAHRLMGNWQPNPAFYAELLGQETSDADISRPYPFCLAHPFESQLSSLGDVAEWQAEWKWDGIRAQVIRRGSRSFIWTRGEELVSDRYPELIEMSDQLPDGTVIDGEILPWRDGAVLPFAQLQRRIGRKTLGKKLLAEVPVVLMAYDLLEWQGRDLRAEPTSTRRALLEQLQQQIATAIPDDNPLLLSPVLGATSWEALASERERSRELNAEGLMFKRLNAPYRVGRVRGDWWKWKINPFTIDAVLIYAQRGSGKRASLYSDYTFGVWDGDQLVPFAKAYSGLTDAEIRQVDAFVRHHTVEKFGPVRTAELAGAMRQRLGMARNGEFEGEEMLAVAPILRVQAKWSRIPAPDELLIERATTREGHHLFVYPFEGRLANEGLAALLAYRLAQLQPISFTIAVNDYGFELLAPEPFPSAEYAALLSPLNLIDDSIASLNATEMARRQFREIARVAGLIFQGYPGEKSMRQVQATSGLIYDVLMQHDPQNLLLDQAQREVLERQLERSRLAHALERIAAGTITVVDVPRITPLAFPLLVDHLREALSSEKLVDRVRKMQLVLEQAAGP